MGEMLDKICCIEEEGTYHNPNETESYEGHTSRLLPQTEITLTRNKCPLVTTLSRIPISLSTVIRINQGNPYDDYVMMKSIGKGAYGNVMKVMHKITGEVRAMKVIPKDNRKLGFTEDEIESEINILKKLEHPNIIKIYETYRHDESYYLINEYCSEGDLGEKLLQAKGFDEVIVKVLMFQILSAVQYLHSKNVIHGDLKLENIMIDSVYSIPSRHISFITSAHEDTESIKRAETVPNINFFSESPKFKFEKMKNFELKLIDFGCSKIFSPKVKRQFEDTIGTLLYCSPEVLKNHYNEKCDVWSCGIIMYLLLSGEWPFYGETEEKITNNILEGKYSFKSKAFKKVSYQAKDLIKKCLIYKQDERITVKEALDHSFFRNDIDPHNIYQETFNSKDVLISLQSFSNHSKFYQAILAFLAHNFAKKDEISKLKKIFLSIDLNFDGKLSKEELLSAYKTAGIKLHLGEVDKILKSIDFDNNGFIEYEEFIRAAIPKESLFTEVNMKTAFDMFDLNKNGSISKSEVKEVLGMGSNVDESVLIELLKEIQNTGEEEISFEQFKKILSSS